MTSKIANPSQTTAAWHPAVGRQLLCFMSLLILSAVPVFGQAPPLGIKPSPPVKGQPNPEDSDRRAKQDPDDESLDPEKLAFFESRIRPALIKHCYECHSAEAEDVGGNLLLDSRESSRSGGDLGAAVVPQKPEESLLLSAIRYDELEMPPSGKLPNAVIADFEKWIREGAVDPRTSDKKLKRSQIDLEKGRAFWCFQPLSSAQPPALEPTDNVGDQDTAISDIDRFLLHRLKTAGMEPAELADRTTLLTRVSFDLTGLPPTPDLIAKFTSGAVDYKSVVDALLESPQFGERFGRHWLDVARYADSSGGGRILLFPDAWRYRDYVIQSFNDDLPFDQFVLEQVAGDLLADDPAIDLATRRRRLTATGFLMLGPHNYELQDKELLRMEVVDEQINVVSRALLGMTASCARCHDHKFDPIPTTDYYALAGIFRSTKSLLPGNVSNFVTTELPLNNSQQQALDSFRQRQAMLKKSIESTKSNLKKLSGKTANFDAAQLSSFAGAILDEEKADRVGDWTASTSVKPFVAKGYLHSKQIGAQITFRIKAPDDGDFQLRAAYTHSSNRTNAANYIVSAVGKTTEHRINQRLAPPVAGHFVNLRKMKLKKGEPVVVKLEVGPNGVTIADAIHLQPHSVAKKKANPNGDAIRELRVELNRLTGELKSLEKKRPAGAPKVMSVRDEDQPDDFFVCIRGNVHSLGKSVPRQALSVVGSLGRFKDLEESGRLELARWMIDKKNPLTARVYANRVWSWLFGRGIVRTPNNFGSTGQQPTHPQLLDFLATKLMQNGWSTKKLVRSIVLSRAYRQASRSSKPGKSRDPENRLLSRYPQKRLDAESIRDRILMFAGTLDRTVGGPAIKPGTRTEFGYVYDSNRRSVYLPVFRNTLNALFEVFDFPNPNLVGGQRNTSTLPTQALYMMNSGFVVKASVAAAQRVIDHAPGNLDEQITFAYQIALAREPTESERELALEFFGPDPLAEQESLELKWRQYCQILIASIDFQYLR